MTIESLKPTILIGLSAKGGAFNHRVVETMSRLNERPRDIRGWIESQLYKPEYSTCLEGANV